MFKYVILGIIILAICLFAAYTIGKNEAHKKSIKELLGAYKGTLTPSNNGNYDYEFKNDNHILYIKVYKVPEFSEIQVNNKTTWEVKYGAGKSLNKPAPYHKYLSNVDTFMNFNPGENGIKIAIITPNPKKIVKYINENEIIFVLPTTDVYGAFIVGEGDMRIFDQYLEKK